MGVNVRPYQDGEHFGRDPGIDIFELRFVAVAMTFLSCWGMVVVGPFDSRRAKSSETGYLGGTMMSRSGLP